MNNSNSLRRFQCLAYLNSDPERIFERHSPVAKTVRQRLAFQILHHQEVDALLVPNVMQNAYPGNKKGQLLLQLTAG
jgi:hypothetical protein